MGVMMNEDELNELIEKNLELAFEHFKKVPEEGSSKDNGNTSRIQSLIEEYS